MNNLTRGQMIFIGVAGLFGIPVCIGFVVGYKAGFWGGVLATVLSIAIIASIALRWSRKRVRQNKEDDNGSKD